MPRVGARGGPGGGGGGGRPRQLLRPGPYLLALASFQRKYGKASGNEYLSMRLKVVGGRSAGTSFFETFMVDLGKQGTLKRWEMYADACGIPKGTEFEVGSAADGTVEQGDEDILRLFRDVPFGAEVEIEYQGQYENNRLARFVFPKQWPAHWQSWADEYRAKQDARSRRAPEDAAGDPDAGGDDYTPAGSDEYDRDPPPYDDGFEEPARRPKPPAEDDDIPF